MKNNNFAQRDATQTIHESMDQLETLRTEELQIAGNLLQQKQQHLRLERERLAAKYGEQYSEVQYIDARLQVDEARTKAIHAEVERSKTQTEPFTVTTWRVNGFVFDENGKGLEGITVYLVDDNHQMPQGLPHACSDAKGFYAITLDSDMVERMKGRSLYLAASSKDIQTPFIVQEPLTASSGIIDYVDIVIKKMACDGPVLVKSDKK